MSNSLDPDQAQQNVGPSLDQNCLQRLSADDKVALAGKELCTFSKNLEQLILHSFASKIGATLIGMTLLTDGANSYFNSSPYFISDKFFPLRAASMVKKQNIL